jgi:hypothetical protein
MTNYRPMLEFGPGERKGVVHLGVAQVFETRDEAMNSARDRFRRWSELGLDDVTAYGADETEDAVNYRWTLTDGDVRLTWKESNR